MLYSFDLETYLITDQDKAPKPVCAVWYNGQGQPFLTLPGDDYAYQLWCDPANHFVGQNIAYDILCMCRWHPKFIPFIIRALDEGRVWDTQIRHQLWYLETKGGLGFPKRISLAKLVKFHLGIDRSAAKKGDDIWRLKYGTLDGVPFNSWPLEALEYVMNDGTDTYNVFQCQGGIDGALATEQLQIRASIAINAVSVWGHYINQENVRRLYGEEKAKLDGLQQQIEQYRIVGKGSDANLAKLVGEGWLVFHKDFCQRFAAERGLGFDPAAYDQLVSSGVFIDTALRYHQNLGYAGMPMLLWSATHANPCNELDELIKQLPPVPFTSGGKKKHKPKLKTGEDDIKPILPFVHALQARADFKHTEKRISTYLAPYVGKQVVHSSYNGIITTGRTSSERPNTQNVPRKGGLRDNFAPRPGHLLGTVDYSGIEMATLAQTILLRLGQSLLAESINKGIDLHCDTAAFFTGKSYDHMRANRDHEPEASERQGAKACNFGIPGGLGSKALCAYAETTYGVKFEESEAKSKIRQWKKKWSDVAQYLKDIAWEVSNTDGGTITAVNNSGRKKADCRYTQAANFPFQSLAADGAKNALYYLWKEHMLAWVYNFVDPSLLAYQYGIEYQHSPLLYSNTVNFVHDEIVQEHYQSPFIEDAYTRQQEIMVVSMKAYVPDVAVRVEGQLGEKWSH